MNLAEMVQELDLIVADPSLKPYYVNWLNQAIEEIALDIDLPTLKRKNPFYLSTSATEWVWPLPETFHKKLFRCLDKDGNQVTICRTVDDLIDLDPDHDETGDRVTHVAVDETGPSKYLYTYPKADDTLALWFYEKPRRLQYDDDVPNLMPPEFHGRVIIPKVVVKNFRLLQDMASDSPHQSLIYWEEQYRKGLYGEPRGEIGLINYLARAKGGPRRHGGRDPLP